MSVGVGDFSSRGGNPVLSYAHYHAIRQMGWWQGDAGNSEWSETEWNGTGSNNFSMWFM